MAYRNPFDSYDDSELDKLNNQVPEPAPAPAPTSTSNPAQDEKAKLIREYLQKKYDAANDDSGIKEAKDRKRNLDIASGIGEGAIALFGASTPSVAYMKHWGEGGAPDMTKGSRVKADFSPLEEAGTRGVKEAQAAKAGKVNEFKQGLELDQLSNTMADQQRANGLRAEEDKIDSEVSRTYQALAKKMMPTRDFSTVSATQLKQTLPALEKIYQADQAAQARRDALRIKNSEKMDIDVRPTVSTLAQKNAGKMSIANQIDSYIKQYDGAKDDAERLAIGRQMLKVLNSPEGADAIGKEEAERLGAKLDFAYGNIFNNNPIQFGRDLDGFKSQAQATSDAIKGAVQANKDEINKLLKRGVTGPDTPAKPSSSPKPSWAK